jgi:hypothetical protein
VTPLETQLLLTRLLLLVFLYAFVGFVGWIAWRDLRSARRDVAVALEAATARLIVIEGAASDRPAGTSFALLPVTAIGRDLDNHVVLGEPTVSGRHAVLNVGEGAWWLEDLGSTNGSFVNGRRVAAGSPEIVRSGDVLQLGAVRMRLVTPDL